MALAAPAEDQPGDESDAQHRQRLRARDLGQHIGKAGPGRRDDNVRLARRLMVADCLGGEGGIFHRATHGFPSSYQPVSASLVPFPAMLILQPVAR